MGKIGGIISMLEILEKMSKSPEAEVKLDGLEIIIGKDYKLVLTGDVKISLKTGKAKKR